MRIDHGAQLAGALAGSVAMLVLGFRAVPAGKAQAWLRRRRLTTTPDACSAADGHLRRRRRGLAVGGATGLLAGVVATLVEPTVLFLVSLGLPGALAGMAVAGLLHRPSGAAAGPISGTTREPLSQLIPPTVSWTRRLLPVTLLAVGGLGVIVVAALTPPDPSPDPLPNMHVLAAAALVFWAVIGSVVVALAAEAALRWRARTLRPALAAASEAGRAVHAAELRAVEGAALGLQSLLAGAVAVVLLLV